MLKGDISHPFFFGSAIKRAKMLKPSILQTFAHKYTHNRSLNKTLMNNITVYFDLFLSLHIYV
jgi:hypothetical protein